MGPRMTTAARLCRKAPRVHTTCDRRSTSSRGIVVGIVDVSGEDPEERSPQSCEADLGAKESVTSIGENSDIHIDVGCCVRIELLGLEAQRLSRCNSCTSFEASSGCIVVAQALMLTVITI